MDSRYEQNFKKILSLFSDCTTPEKVYQKIILLGKEPPSLSKEFHTPSNKVLGCQSTLYVSSTIHEGLLEFRTWSDALISAGLARLATLAYSGLSPEEVLKQDPTFLQALNLGSLLTPSRSNGLANLILKIKKNSIPYL